MHHTPSPTKLLAGGSLCWFTDAREGLAQVPGERGRGTAFGEITEAEGLRSWGEQDSWVPSARSPRT